MSTRTHLLVPLALALLVALAGCTALGGGGNQDDDGLGEGQEIRSEVANEMAAVDSYNFSMVTSVEFGENEQVTESNGTVDVDAQRMVTESITTIRTNSSRTRQGSTSYVFGDQQCLNLDGDWEQSTVDRSPWRSATNVSVLTELLNSSSARLYNDTYDGQDVHVIVVEPSDQAVQTLLGDTETDVEFNDVTYTQYVDTESKRLLRSDMNASYFTSGREVDLTVSMRFSDFNTSHEIELPRAAVGSNDNGPCAGMANGTSASVAP
jgi:outer membrane lipoprotein-sorting protein